MIAAIVPAPCSAMTASMAPMSIGGTMTKPGAGGPQFGWKAARPVAAVAPMVVPWYPLVREMIVDFSGCPLRAQ